MFVPWFLSLYLVFALHILVFFLEKMDLLSLSLSPFLPFFYQSDLQKTLIRIMLLAFSSIFLEKC